jgi:hypothetical protein
VLVALVVLPVEATVLPAVQVLLDRIVLLVAEFMVRPMQTLVRVERPPTEIMIVRKAAVDRQFTTTSRVELVVLLIGAAVVVAAQLVPLDCQVELADLAAAAAATVPTMQVVPEKLVLWSFTNTPNKIKGKKGEEGEFPTFPFFLEEMNKEQIRKELDKRGCLDARHFLGKEGLYRIQQNFNEFTDYIFFLREKFPNGIDEYLAIGVAGAGDLRAISELVGIKHATVIDLGVFDPDIQRNNLDSIGRNKITLFHGDSHTLECEKFLSDLNKTFDLIFVDGDHSYKGALMDTKLVLKHCHKDTLIAFHDVEIDNDKVSKVTGIDLRKGKEINANPIHPEGPQGSNLAYQDAIKMGLIVEVVKFFDEKAEIPIGIGVTRKR